MRVGFGLGNAGLFVGRVDGQVDVHLCTFEYLNIALEKHGITFYFDSIS
jgi:hypothetical protein